MDWERHRTVERQAVRLQKMVARLNVDAIALIRLERGDVYAKARSVAGKAQEHELIWHLAQMLPRLGIAEQECNEVAALLFGYLENESRIVKTCALQAIFELAEEDDALRPKIQALIVELASKETGALRARLNSREVRM
jgi:hypothetical protein